MLVPGLRHGDCDTKYRSGTNDLGVLRLQVEDDVWRKGTWER